MLNSLLLGNQISHGMTILITSIVDKIIPFSFMYLCRWTDLVRISISSALSQGYLELSLLDLPAPRVLLMTVVIGSFRNEHSLPVKKKLPSMNDQCSICALSASRGRESMVKIFNRIPIAWMRLKASS